MNSNLLIGISENVRFAIVDTSDIVKKSCEFTDVNLQYRTREIMLTNIAALMSMSIKDKSSISLVLKCDKVLGRAKVRVNGLGHIVSNSNFDAQKLNDLLNEKDLNEYRKKLSHGSGNLLIEIDYLMKQPYYTEIEVLENEDLDEVMHKFFNKSMQSETILKTDFLFDKDLNFEKSAGIFIQMLPSSDKNVFEKLKRKLKMIYDPSFLLSKGMDLEAIAKLIFEDEENPEKLIEDYKILEKRQLIFKCSCSREKMKALIEKVCKKEELDEIFEKEKYVESVCGFCNGAYRYEKEEF